MFRIVGDRLIKTLITALPGASTVTGFISSSDVGKLVTASSNNYTLALGTTADVTLVSGIVASVPAATTPGSTVPFYIQPIARYEMVEADFSTAYSTALPATTDIGKWVGLSNTTTVAGAVISMATLSNSVGTTSGNFLKICEVDVPRRVVRGFINSTHLQF